MDIDLSDYVAGGYFIMKYAEQGFWRSELMPERVISLSNCICIPLEIVWGWNVEQYSQDILDFGISPTQFDAFKVWCNGKTPGAIYSLEAAREFIAEFLPEKEDVILIGIGLPNDLVESFLVRNTQTVLDTKTKVIREDYWSVDYVLNDGKPPPEGGKPLGFEVISYFGSTFSDTWLCSLLEREMYELFKIRTNEHGLINTYHEALKVYEWLEKIRCKVFAPSRCPIIPGCSSNIH